MLEILRDPAWNGIAGIAAIIALIVAVRQEKRVINTLPRVFIVIGRAIIGILVISFGPSLQWFVEGLFAGGIPLVIQNWQSTVALYGWNAFALGGLFYSAFSGTATASIASSKKKNAFLRTSIVAIITLILTDILIFTTNGGGIYLILGSRSFIFTIFSNVVGGFIAATIIFYLVRIYDNAFGVFLKE